MADRLSQDVWALILQHVPQADRLKHCALVCTKLSRATAAATVTLKVSLCGSGNEQRRQRAEIFDSYLQHHGSHVTSLVLDRRSQPLAQLPCPKLLHLDLSHVDGLQLGPHGDLPGVLDSASGLTSLELSYSIATPDGGGLSRLSVLVDLRHLQMQLVQWPGGRSVPLPGSVLPSLAHLTRLYLSYVEVEDVHHVSSLTNLSVLSIGAVEGPQPLRLAPDIAPGFALPASLQQLRLGEGVVLAPAVFAAATQLTSIELVRLSVERQGGGVSGGAALLAAVAGLQQLVTLQLRELRGVVWPARSAAYSALTASSRLQKLVVNDCGLPEGVGEHVLPPASCYPALREFAVSEAGIYWGAEAVLRVVRCCPGLQDLGLCVCGGADVAAVKPLAALTNLVLFADCSYNQADVGVSAGHVAALTSLRRLHLCVMTEGADAAARAAAALLPLTALRGLTECSVFLSSVPVFDSEDEEFNEAEAMVLAQVEELFSLCLSNAADPGQPPDVWLHLQQGLREEMGPQGTADAAGAILPPTQQE